MFREIVPARQEECFPQWHCFTHLYNDILKPPPFSILILHLPFPIYFVYIGWFLQASFNKMLFMILSAYLLSASPSTRLR